jgi:hypothetical protein
MIHTVTNFDQPPVGTVPFKNSKGAEIKLSKLEQRICNEIQRRVNALGMEVNITTLTTLMKKISEQKFFEITPSEYMPVVAGGEGAWSTNLVTYRSFLVGDSFFKGKINMGGNNGRLSTVSTAVDSVMTKVYTIAFEIGWTLMELQTAAKAGNWDMVSNLEKSRKKTCDLGIQQVAFLGEPGFNGVSSAPNVVNGLLTQPGITVDTTTITGPLSNMDAATFTTFLKLMLQVFRKNCFSSAWPNRFVIPESDFLGLMTPMSPTFPAQGTSKLKWLEENLGIMTHFDGKEGRDQFKILPCKYGDGGFAGSFGGDSANQVYALYNSNEESFRMNLPVPYTTSLANSLNNVQFQNGAWLQYTGLQALRPLEMVYFKHAASLSNY